MKRIAKGEVWSGIDNKDITIKKSLIPVCINTLELSS